jgi:hypothetical protein
MGNGQHCAVFKPKQSHKYQHMLKQCVVVGSPPNNDLAGLLLLALCANAAQRMVDHENRRRKYLQAFWQPS